jgi:hypothetical protein
VLYANKKNIDGRNEMQEKRREKREKREKDTVWHQEYNNQL